MSENEDENLSLMKKEYRYPVTSDDSLQSKIYNKREFYINKVQPREKLDNYEDLKKYRDDVCGGKFALKSQQVFVANFMNPTTPYTGMLIFHGTGTGKTCAAIAIAENKQIDVIQIPFNIFDNLNHRGEVLKIAKKNGKIVQTRSVFLQGLFFMSPNINNSIVQKLSKELLLLDALSKEKKINIENIALNYALFQKKIDLVLVGVNSIKELDDMFKSINSNKINFEILDVINNIKILNKNLLNPSNWI
jgi:hypothetical protein